MAAGSAALSLRPSQLDRFLHALVGTEHNGMETSVLSVLARSGYDPWAEAVRLAGLPRAVAVDDLAGALASVPPGNRPHAEAKAVALRLVRLLPAPTRLASSATSAKVSQGSRRTVVVLAGTLLSAALAFGLLVGTAFWPAVHVDLPGIATDALASKGQHEGLSHQGRTGRLIPLHSGFDGLGVSGIEHGQVGAVYLDSDTPSCAGVRAVQRCWMSCTGSALPHVHGEVRQLVARGISEPANP